MKLSHNLMDLLAPWFCSLIFSILLSAATFKGASGATFTFINSCGYTVWPGILANSGTPRLDSTGFQLAQGSSRSFQAPTGWSGRFWGRTGCNFDASGQGSCSTGDCGSGQVECNGAGAAPPATLAEFTLGSGSQDFYDVSLVDGYNLPMVVEGTGGVGTCAATGCVTDLNRQCPAELRVGEGDACKSACEAFGSPEYCCSGEYGTPTTCRPSVYSTMFKTACPRSYSYAYDDATSTFTCTGADYTITFCPSYANSQKSSKDPEPIATPDTTYGSGSASASGTGAGMGYGSGSETGSGADQVTATGTGTGTGSGGVMMADASWLAGLAVGDSSKAQFSALQPTSMVAATTVLIISFFYL